MDNFFITEYLTGELSEFLFWIALPQEYYQN